MPSLRGLAIRRVHELTPPIHELAASVQRFPRQQNNCSPQKAIENEIQARLAETPEGFRNIARGWTAWGSRRAQSYPGSGQSRPSTPEGVVPVSAPRFPHTTPQNNPNIYSSASSVSG